MATTITLNVELKDNKVLSVLQNIDKTAKKIDGKKIKLDVETPKTEPIKKTSDAIQYLTTSAAKYDAQLKEAEAVAKRFSAALQSQMQAAENAKKAHQGMASTLNGIDKEIAENEAAAKRFSAALREQMLAEQEAEKAHQGMASSLNVIDQAIQYNEQASKSFSEQLRKQMEEEQRGTKTSKDFSISLQAVGVALGNIASRAFHVAIQKISQAFREALATMKEVDSELANIQKVTDQSDAAIARLGDTAYETASKYGIAANEYLAAAGDFAKAGYDNYDVMAELATKTQLVGDVSDEVASKFLLSADAAWKFGGNINDLSTVLDKANTIENNYATSIEKLASGLPLVASTAAMAGMSVDETLAALGTITAKTQESGTMAARALRALILNILGDTQTEIEEGVTWTEDELKSLNGLLWQYAGEAMKTAQQNGGVVNPMEAIRALHDAYEEGLLTQKDLTDLAMDLGGKLRTNQLLALITNLDTFDEMLGKTADSAGSADKEIGVMLGTWNSKVNILQNSWSEFVSHLIETDTIKGAVDLLTDLVNALDSVVDSTTSWDIEKTISSIDEEMESLLSKEDELTHWEQVRLDYLQQQKAEMEAQLRLTAKNEVNRAFEGSKALYDEWGNEIAGTGRSDQFSQMRLDLSNAMTNDAVKGAKEYRESLQQILNDYGEIYEIVSHAKDLGVVLTDEQAQFVREYERIQNAVNATDSEVDQLYKDIDDGNLRLNTQTEKDVYYIWRKGIQEVGQETDEAVNSIGDAENKATELSDTLYAMDMNNAVEQAGTLSSLFSSIATKARSIGAAIGGAGQSVSNLSGGDDSVFAFGAGMASGGESPGGRTLVNELGPELISDNGRAYIANGGKPAVINLSPGAIVIPADETREALRGGMPRYARAYRTDSESMRLGGFASGILSAATTAVEQLLTATGSGSGGGGGGGGGGSATRAAKSIEELAKETSDLLSNLDKQAKLAANEGDYAKEAQIYEQAQEAIKKMVDAYRKAGYKDDSDEILDLLNKNYDYANKQLTLYQTKWDELIDALDADTAAQEAANTLAEKQQAVEDARAALANAQKQRTVRMYNAATGQWEWVADDAKIQSAQKAVTSAEDSYNDTLKSQARAELERLKETSEDLTEVVLGPALSQVAMMAESTQEFQNFARALNAVYGVGSFLGSTEGSSKVLNTTDSHDTVYSFGNISLTSEQAQTMTVAQLAQQLKVLGLTS